MTALLRSSQLGVVLVEGSASLCDLLSLKVTLASLKNDNYTTCRISFLPFYCPTRTISSIGDDGRPK